MHRRVLVVDGTVGFTGRKMMHAKVLRVEDGWANVGTANWDNRSMALQEEINCSIVDPGVVTELEKDFLHDFEGAEEIDLARWRRRPVQDRALEATSAAFRHSLRSARRVRPFLALA